MQFLITIQFFYSHACKDLKIVWFWLSDRTHKIFCWSIRGSSVLQLIFFLYTDFTQTATSTYFTPNLLKARVWPLKKCEIVSDQLKWSIWAGELYICSYPDLPSLKYVLTYFENFSRHLPTPLEEICPLCYCYCQRIGL